MLSLVNDWLLYCFHSSFSDWQLSFLHSRFLSIRPAILLCSHRERLFSFHLVFLLSFFLEILLSWCLEILFPTFFSIRLQRQLSVFQSSFQSWNLLQIKEEKPPVSRSVRRCPRLSLFVHQSTILQHFKSPLLCNGVTNRKGRADETGRVFRRAYRCTLTPIRPWRILIFAEKIARCVSWHTKPFFVPQNALPLTGVKITPKS